jgi:hypothetical protein
MATARATISPGYILTASSPPPAEAPITYSINGVVVATDRSITDIGVFFNTVEGPPGVFNIFAQPSNVKIFSGTTINEVGTFTSGLNNATESVLREIARQVRTAAPISILADPPISLPVVPATPEPTPDVTGTSETDTSEPRTISEPQTTTNPSNLLPLGDDINDIYDPNLTPEQIASLDPRDQELRRQFFSGEDDEDPGVDSTGGEIIVEGAAANTAAEQELRAAGAEQDSFVFQGRKDWRVRLALSDAPEVNYLYRAPNPGILQPLNVTGGVIFPYTPTISVNYTANYNPTELVHSNYKVYQYSSSSIDSITIACDFTAQSISEADYLLAVIHFFRSATKMFYGQDENPRRGTPPPLCYIYGMGSYQFAGQPLAISQFSYNLPNNVDYIKTSSNNVSAALGSLATRLSGTGAAPGGKTPPPSYIPTQEPDTISWVPSKIQLSITCVPMLSRNQVSNRFSLQDYASGALLNGIGKPGGGFW